ncbi:MAG: hypothetical protein AABM30_01400 [Actinomycetota bacterium]
MYGLTRGALTLIGAAAAGVLLWLAASIVSNDELSMGEFWAAVGLVAAAGLTMAFSQLLGGWTKWGVPRVSGNVFLMAFLPALIAGGWIVSAAEPGDHWLGSHAREWSGDLGIGGLVGDLTAMVPAIAFGIGLVFGLTFDTTGPRLRKAQPVTAGAQQEPQVAEDVPPAAPAEHGGAAGGDGDGDGVADDRRVHIRQGGASSAPEPEPAPKRTEPDET